MDRVRQISRSCDLYTAKLVKASDTPAGFSKQGEVSCQTLRNRLISIPMALGAKSESEGAAASKGFDNNLTPSARGTKCERGNCDVLASPMIGMADLASGEQASQDRGSVVVMGVTPHQGNGSAVTGRREPVQPQLGRSKG